MRPALHVEFDETACQCITYCESICPAVFRVNPDRNKAEVIQSVVTDPDLFPALREAEQTCPTQAFRLVEVFEEHGK